eukprot:92013_1
MEADEKNADVPPPPFVRRVSSTVDIRREAGWDKQNITFVVIVTIYILFDILCVVFAFMIEEPTNCAANFIIKIGVIPELGFILIILIIAIYLVCKFGAQPRAIINDVVDWIDYINTFLFVILIIYGLYILVISILGFIYWQDMDIECKSSPLEICLFIWSGLKIIGILIIAMPYMMTAQITSISYDQNGGQRQIEQQIPQEEQSLMVDL